MEPIHRARAICCLVVSIRATSTEPIGDGNAWGKIHSGGFSTISNILTKIKQKQMSKPADSLELAIEQAVKELR